MKRRLFGGVLLACLSSFLNAKGPLQPLDVFDFSKGHDSYHATTTLPDGTVQDSLNVLYDDRGPVTKRQGYTVAWTTKTYQYTGLWTYVDASNNAWQIARSSDQITANKLDGTASIKISTVTSNDTVGEVNAFGYAYFVDPTQGVYYWNGTSTTYLSGSPHGSIINQFHSRLWVSGAAIPNGNQLYGSKYNDGNTWTTGLNATDPVQYSIGLNDNFDNVTALYVYLDTQYLFKKFSIFSLTGFDQSSFNIGQLTQECGCIDQGSIQTYNGGLKFMSLRGVETFNGYTCERISGPVKDKVDPAIARAFNTNSWIQTSQSDFQAGSSSPTAPYPALSMTISAGDVQPSSFSKTETSSSSGWASGTGTNVAVGVSSISLLSNNSGTVDDPSFESCSGGSLAATKWTSSSYGCSTSETGGCGTISPQSGTYMARVACSGANCSTWEFRVIDLDGNTIQSQSIPFILDCAWRQATVTPSAANFGRRVKFRFHTEPPASTDLTTTASFLWGGALTFYYAATLTGGSVFAFDNIQNGSSTISTGSFTSVAQNTSLPYSHVYSSADWTSTDSRVAVVLQKSANGSTGWYDVTTSTGADSQIAQSYVRYISSFTDAQSYLSGVQITARSSGTYISQVKSAPNLNTFGNFNVTYTNGSGSQAFYVRSATYPFTIYGTSPVWAAQTANAAVAASSGTYFQVFDSFTVVSATATPPVLNDFSISWFEGTRPPPMASTVWDNRYWLALATNTADSNNDAVLVLNSAGKWAYLNMKIGGLTQYKNSLYHADATATGSIYLDNQGYADNGTAINAYIKTKDFSMGDISRDHFLAAIIPSMDNGGSCNVTFQYTPDKAATSYSLGTVSQSEFAIQSSVRLPVPVDSSHQNFGRTFNFQIGTNDATCPWTFYGLRGLYRQRPTEGSIQ